MLQCPVVQAYVDGVSSKSFFLTVYSCFCNITKSNLTACLAVSLKL